MVDLVQRCTHTLVWTSLALENMRSGLHHVFSTRKLSRRRRRARWGNLVPYAGGEADSTEEFSSPQRRNDGSNNSNEHVDTITGWRRKRERAQTRTEKCRSNKIGNQIKKMEHFHFMAAPTKSAAGVFSRSFGRNNNQPEPGTK